MLRFACHGTRVGGVVVGEIGPRRRFLVERWLCLADFAAKSKI